MKKILQSLVEKGYTITEIANEINSNYSEVRSLLKKNNLSTSGYLKINNWNKEKLLEAIKKSKNKSDILRNMNISTCAGNFVTLDKYCLKYEIDISGLIHKPSGCFKKSLKNEDVFCKNSKVSTSTAKKRIKKENLIEYKCEKCENKGKWMGEKITLQLDHKDGDKNNNELINFRYLCPNCHSQTETYGSKRLKKKSVCVCGKEKNKKSNICFDCRKEELKKSHTKIKATKEELEKFLETMSIDEIAKKFNVNRASIREKIKKFGININYKPRTKFDVEKNVLEKLIKEKSYVEIGKMFNVTDNSIKKRAKKLGIELVKRK